MHKETVILLAAFNFIFIFPCLSSPADTAVQQDIDAAINRIRQDPSDFSAWLEFRQQNRVKGTSEKNISKFEPILIAICDKNANTMILAAVIIPGKDGGLYDVNAPENNTPQKLREIAAYVKTLDWYTAGGGKMRVENPKILAVKISGQSPTSRLSLGSCRGDIITTCPFINPGEVDEINQDWKRYYKKAKKKNKSLSKLTWLFLSKNRHVWGIGYELTEEAMLPGQPLLRGARIELISKTSNGSCRVKLN